MANPDDSDFDDFVAGALNCTFSSAIHDDDISDNEDVLLNNISDSEESVDLGQQQTRGRPTTTNPTGTLWLDVTNNDPGPSKTIPIYNLNSGPNLPSHFDENSLPIEYFELFFNDEILEYICQETNLFANKKNRITLHMLE